METFFSDYPWLAPVIFFFILWESVWKMIALWKSARGGQLAWFVCIGILNTIGILPIIYILFFQKKPDQAV